MGFKDFFKNDFIQEGDGQVASGSASLPDRVALETEEQMLEREQNVYRMSMIFLKHWVSTRVTKERLSRTCLRLLT